jgi:hypothetical protein
MRAVTYRALADFPDQLEAHYAAFAPEFTRWAPASWDGVSSEALTAVEQLCHVRDIEIDGYQVRIRRTLEEAHPTLASIDTDALVRERAYARDDPARARRVSRGAHADAGDDLGPVRRAARTHRLLRRIRAADTAQPDPLPVQP